MSEAELEEANEMLCCYGYLGKRKTDVDELKEIALDVYHQPTKYIDAIRQYQYMKSRRELANSY